METMQKSINKMTKAPLNDRIRILHIIKSLGRGGAETLLPETLSLHNQELFEFHYIYFLPWKDQMVNQIKDAGGIIHCFEAINNIEIFRKVKDIIAYIKQNEIKLIQCHLPWAGIVGRIAGRLTNIPVIYTEHNKWERYHKLTYFINKLSFGLQTNAIAVSNDVALSIRKHYKHSKPEINVVLNGINVNKFTRNSIPNNLIREKLKIPESAIVIGTACVFRVQKRLLAWLEIAKLIHDEFPNVHFIIAGDGPLKDVIQQKAQGLHTFEYVHFVGLQENIKPYLKAMDIFMMSSEFEGLPIALLEAMSMECMPACTAAGGIPELIKNQQNGLLAPVTSPLDLVQLLRPFLQSPNKILQLAAAARQTVVNSFSLHQMVQQLETIYSNTLNSKN